LAVTLVENLTARQGSQVLIIAVVDPDSTLPGALRSQVRRGLTSRLVHDAEADPDMGYGSRLELARQLCPNLRDAGARRIAQRTTTFAEVFTVAAAPRLGEIDPSDDEDAVRAVVDAAASGRLTRPAPSEEATVIAWAGGLVHARQADRALGILGTSRIEGDPDVRRWGSLERLADPAGPRLADQVATGLTGEQRRNMGATFLGEALALTADREADLVDKVAALQAVHRVRADLPTRGELPQAQAELVAGLEALGDQAAALQVATEALTEWPKEGEQQDERDTLAGAVIRLSHITPQAPPGPLAGQLIAEAVAGGAVTGLEARIWAAIVLLGTPGEREAALNLAGQVTADLDARPGLGAAGDRWRLRLAFHAGRAGLPDLTTRLLGPLIASGDPAREDAANMVLRAVDGPGADIRLRTILLEAELAALPPGADDDRLRIHHALAANHDTLGDYRQALAHGQRELDLRTHIQGPRHPNTLTTRADIAAWTGGTGDPAGALSLCQELLHDQKQALGPRHPDTLATRGNTAYWAGASGDPAGALSLSQELLPDVKEVIGPRTYDTLALRGNVALWTGASGDLARALSLSQELLPDMEEVLGHCHPITLTTRGNNADWTGASGDLARALSLCQELLPDMEEVLGRRHPDTLARRAKIAFWIGASGDPARALRLCQELLPDMDEVLGRRHRDTLGLRAHVAFWTGASGDPARALRLYQELLPDVEQTVGPRHPDTLTIRAHIADLTGESGDDC
jgi:hypothetical protein